MTAVPVLAFHERRAWSLVNGWRHGRRWCLQLSDGVSGLRQDAMMRLLGSRSVKMRRRQSDPPQKNFRVCKEIRTGIPSQGRSPSSRTYRLCTRRDMPWHAGQTADARQARRRISMVPSFGRSKTSSTSEVSGNSVPRPIGMNGERQSYSLSTPRRLRWKESPNMRMNPKQVRANPSRLHGRSSLIRPPPIRLAA